MVYLRRHMLSNGRAGFTLIEIMVVIAVIILLMSLLAVALGKATSSARATKSLSTLKTIGQALNQFESEIGYLPPVLSRDRVVVNGPAPGGGN